jgi:hypothetical protein
MANTKTSSRTLPFRLCNVVGADGEIDDDAPLSLILQLAKEDKLPPKVRHNHEVLMFADTPSPQKCPRRQSHRRYAGATESESHSADDDPMADIVDRIERLSPAIIERSSSIEVLVSMTLPIC